MKKLRLKVKEIAEAKGMSMMALTRKSYVALNTIRSIYHDPYRAVNTDTLLRLADALEVSIFDLLEELPGDTEKGAEE
jgi:DNA-binding Xre family transcriptional regulator